MTWLKRGLVAALVILALGFLGFNLFKKQIAMSLFERVVAERAGVDPTSTLPDGLHVFLCGAGSPMPDMSRAGPCVGVLAGERAYVFDIGSGGARNLGSMQFPFARIERVYLTHLHSDHLDGLGELMVLSWVAGNRSEPTPVVGPVGTQQIVDGFNMAYQIDSTYRTAHHGPEIADPEGFGGVASEITIPAGPGGTAIVFQDEVLKITAIRVSHAPVEPAFGYRVDYKDRSISLSGDTIYHPEFVVASEGVDVMFHEALDPEMVSFTADQLAERDLPHLAKTLRDTLDYHATPEDAARTAHNAGADELVYYHIVPPLPAKLLYSIFLGDSKSEFDGPMTVGEDGLLITLPAGSDRVIKSKAF